MLAAAHAQFIILRWLAVYVRTYLRAFLTKHRDMPGPPVSGAEPGFPGDPVSPAYPRLGPAAGSWRETRQTRRSPVLRNQVKNEKNTKNEHHATGSGWPCGLVQARSQR